MIQVSKPGSPHGILEEMVNKTEKETTAVTVFDKILCISQISAYILKGFNWKKTANIWLLKAQEEL